MRSVSLDASLRLAPALRLLVAAGGLYREELSKMLIVMLLQVFLKAVALLYRKVTNRMKMAVHQVTWTRELGRQLLKRKSLLRTILAPIQKYWMRASGSRAPTFRQPQ